MITNTAYILKWIEKSRTEEDNFDKFVYGFFALNAMYSEYYTTGERGAIKALFRDNYERSRSEFESILSMPEYEYFCNRAPIKNMKYNPDDPDGVPDTLHDTNNLQKRDPKNSNRSMLMILYQIRCNLFHGNKSFSLEGDQEIMKNAAELLLRYNDIFSKNLIKNRS